jgi:tripartite-type tricarboxylate transporter receptor subunit TctC
MVVIAANHVVNPSLYRNVPFDPVKDFKPIVRVAFAPFILTVNPSLPVNTLKEFIAYAKAHPGEINYASPGNGSPAHLATELLKTETGINLTHIPGPAELRPEVVSQLSGEITRIVQQPDTARRISGLGLEMSLMQSAQFAEYMSREEARWAEVVRRSGARRD